MPFASTPNESLAIHSLEHSWHTLTRHTAVVTLAERASCESTSRRPSAPNRSPQRSPAVVGHDTATANYTPPPRSRFSNLERTETESNLQWATCSYRSSAILRFAHACDKQTASASISTAIVTMCRGPRPR